MGKRLKVLFVKGQSCPGRGEGMMRERKTGLGLPGRGLVHSSCHTHGASNTEETYFSLWCSAMASSKACPERSAESCRISFPATISRMYLPLSESLGSRMWSQISFRVVPALTRSLLSRRFSLNVRANERLPGSVYRYCQAAVCLQVYPLLELLC